MADKIEEPPELVKGLLHQGCKMVLGGGSKTFKTWTLIDLAVSVASGRYWLQFDTTKGKVLFANFEIQSAFFQKRLSVVASEKGVQLIPGQIDVWNLRGYAAAYDLVLPSIQERIAAAGYSLVVLDPIYKLYGNTNENSAGEVARLLNALEQLAVASGAAVAFGAHYSKGNQANKEAIDRISGSGVFARDPDTILSFTRHEEEDSFTVDATLRNHAPLDPFVVRWQYPFFRRDGALDPSKLKQSGGRPKSHTVEKIMTVLKTGPKTTSQWQKDAGSETGISKTRFYALLEEAKKSPELKQTTDGKWFIEQPGQVPNPVSEPVSGNMELRSPRSPVTYSSYGTGTGGAEQKQLAAGFGTNQSSRKSSASTLLDPEPTDPSPTPSPAASDSGSVDVPESDPWDHPKPGQS